jgi:TRAP-type C4-dicarboxylate transport system permease small subunit
MGDVMDRLLRWLEPIIHALTWVGLLAGLLMMLHITADVAGKVFRSPIIGTTEIASGYYMIAVAYLPWAWIARNDDHISVELFTRNLPPAAMAWLDIAIKTLTAFFVAVFVWQTWVRALQQYAAGEAIQVGGTYWIVWPSRFLLPVAGGMMVLYLVVRIARDLGLAVRR